MFKRGIVKASELPASDHTRHTAWGLCGKTVSRQGLVSPTRSSHLCCSLPVNSLAQNLSTFFFWSKNSLALCAYNTHLYTRSTSSTLLNKQKKKKKGIFLFFLSVTPKSLYWPPTSSHTLFLNCFIFQIFNFQKQPTIFLRNIFWKSVECLGISSCHFKRF